MLLIAVSIHRFGRSLQTNILPLHPPFPSVLPPSVFSTLVSSRRGEMHIDLIAGSITPKDSHPISCSCVPGWTEAVAKKIIKIHILIPSDQHHHRQGHIADGLRKRSLWAKNFLRKLESAGDPQKNGSILNLQCIIQCRWGVGKSIASKI